MDAGGAVRGASGIGNAGPDARAAAGVRRLEPAPPLTFCLRRLIGGASLTSCVYDSSVGEEGRCRPWCWAAMPMVLELVIEK